MIFTSINHSFKSFGSNDNMCCPCHAELDDVVLLLCCCTRILPLLEFDTSLSQVATSMLASVFTDLCSPKLVQRILDAQQLEHGDIQFVMTSKSPRWMHRSTIHFTGSAERVEMKESCFRCGTSESHRVTAIRSLVHHFSAMLEVFVDEFILHPCLGKAFLNGGKESSGFFPKPSICGKHIEVSLEALFVHCLLSLSKGNVCDIFIHKLFDWHTGNTRGARISLPAAVLLLDSLVLIKAPQIFKAHILVLISEAVTNDSLPTYGELPMELALSQYFSVFESAVKLYMKHLSLQNVSNDHEGLENPALESCLIKHRDLQLKFNLTSDSLINLMWNEKHCLHRHNCCSSQKISSSRSHRVHSSRLLKSLCMHIKEQKDSLDDLCRDEISNVLHHLVVKAFSTDCESDTPCCMHRNANPGTYLLAAILELMGSSLSQIVHIVKEKGGSGNSSPLDQYLLPAYYDYTIDLMVNCFGRCPHMQPMGIVLNNIMAKMLVRHRQSVGPVLSYFAGELCLEFQMGSELLCKGYMSVMKSLMSLLVLEEGGIDILNALVESSELSVDYSDISSEGVINQGKPSMVPQAMAMRVATRPSTQMILNYLKNWHKFSGSRNQRASKEEVIDEEEELVTELSANNVESKKSCTKNIYVQSVIKIQGTTWDDFSDLNDFIICKKDKDYSAWLKKLCRVRKRKYHREFFQRMKKRKELLVLLSMDKQLLCF
eukprot:Gb_05338 [translate_table: standard]